MFLVIILSSLLRSSLSACNFTAFALLERCQNDDVANPPCSEPCQTAVQATNECTQRDQDLESVFQTYSFCKSRPAARCKLILQRELCRGSCQWCNSKCLTRGAVCQKAPVNCSSLVQLQCNTQCQWCADTQACSKACPPSASSSLSSSSETVPTPASSIARSACVDDPDGMVAQQGFSCETVLQVTSNNCDYDLSALSPQIPKGVTPSQICPKSCQRCNTSVASFSSDNATVGVSDSTNNCEDDPEGLAGQQGLTCTTVMQYANNNCDLDLNSLNPNVPAGLTAAKLCPKTCNRCNGAAASPKTQACIDDPSGLVKSNGFSCATVLSVTGNNCDEDLSTLSSSIPKGVTPGQICPKSCGRCKDANGTTAPVPQRTTDTFLNGKLVTATQKRWLQGLGVQLPPGRFFLRADGSVGLEGGPVLMNIYQTTGQKVDTAVTGAMRDSGIENAAVKTVDWTKQAAQTTGQAITQAAQQTKTGFQNFASKVSNFFG